MNVSFFVMTHSGWEDGARDLPTLRFNGNVDGELAKCGESIGLPGLLVKRTADSVAAKVRMSGLCKVEMSAFHGGPRAPWRRSESL